MQIVYRRRESHKELKKKSDILVLKLQQDLETRNI